VNIEEFFESFPTVVVVATEATSTIRQVEEKSFFVGHINILVVLAIIAASHYVGRYLRI
jgi:hypothetical protein